MTALASEPSGLRLSVESTARPGPEDHERTPEEHQKRDLVEKTGDAHYDTGERLGFLLVDKWYGADEVDTRAEHLSPARLSYPQALAGSRTSGRVKLALFIDEEGLIRKAQVLESHPQRIFDDAAIRAWEEVRFAPALKYGQPVKSEKLLEIEFMPD